MIVERENMWKGKIYARREICEEGKIYYIFDAKLLKERKLRMERGGNEGSYKEGERKTKTDRE